MSLTRQRGRTIMEGVVHLHLHLHLHLHDALALWWSLKDRVLTNKASDRLVLLL